jgi:hypothetical protein
MSCFASSSAVTDAVICPTFVIASVVYISRRDGNPKKATSLGPRR